jgi:seryl-tRNA synthetase
MFKDLELPFRRVNVCTGDIGPKQAKQYDIEGWHVDGKYRERTSCSNCLDWQALRGNIRYETKQKERKYLHTLNNTGMATSRAMISILEVYQQKDYSVKIPKALQKYMNGKKKIGGIK